jgi:hypothetical protein
MAFGKTKRYRYNIKVKIILSQVPKSVMIGYGKGATNIWKWA